MAWTDEFNDVSWTNGDYLSEIKLDQMVTNERWNRDQNSVSNIPGPDDYRWFGAHNYDDDTYYGLSFGTWQFQLMLNSTPLYTASVSADSSSWITARTLNGGYSTLDLVTAGSTFDIGFRWTRSGVLIGEESVEVGKTQSMAHLSFGFKWRIGYYEDDTGADYRRALWKDAWFIVHGEPETW